MHADIIAFIAGSKTDDTEHIPYININCDSNNSAIRYSGILCPFKLPVLTLDLVVQGSSGEQNQLGLVSTSHTSLVTCNVLSG